MNPAETSLLPRVLLGAAAGAATTLGASSAAAAPIVFDPIDVTITASAAGVGIYFDPQTGYTGAAQAEGTTGLNAEFELLYDNNTAAKPAYRALNTGTQIGQAVRNASVYAPRFDLGVGINGGSGTFTNSAYFDLHNTSTTTTYPWNPGDRGYLALGFTANAATGTVPAGTQIYGWAEVSYNADQTYTLYRFGYDNSGGTSIAGAVPEPGSLSAAAVLGAAGLLAYRRRRSAAAAQA